ncbi:hypothetical protein FN846DRAFT_980251 [Sphaerosporella brunnea]|uniref:DUF7708 domain-containing protein n=1 Tax=Sphaerosporella brunnea TaxID=1250544 RepID=A0A5J5EDP5_9PEZI|nr:hypothetical protein FN846DRAFT_980251 [Sphaerosporella brunnea]
MVLWEVGVTPLARIYEQALRRYQKLHDEGRLKPKHFQTIKGPNSIQGVLETVRNAKTKNESERNAIKSVLLSASETVVDKLVRFQGVVDTAIQANPNISSLVWGGVKFVLMIARDIFDTYEMACELVLKVTFCLERFASYTETYQDRVGELLESRLVNFYDSLLEFCIAPTRFYHKGSFGKLFSSLRNPINERFLKLAKQLDSHAEEVHKAEQTEHMGNTRKDTPDRG